MSKSPLFGARYEEEWFLDRSKVCEFLSDLCEEFEGEERVERSAFNAWLTEITGFCLPAEVAKVAQWLLNQAYIVAELYGTRSVRYAINHEVINHFMVEDQRSSFTGPEASEVKRCSELSELVRNPDKLRTMLRALLAEYRDDYAAKRMSYIGMAKAALGSVGKMRIKHADPSILSRLLERRGFMRHFGVQLDVPGRLELRRDNIESFLATGIIPWVSQRACTHQPQTHTQPEDDNMANVEEFEAEGLRVMVKVSEKCPNKIPKLAPAMLHTVLKEAGFMRGSFNFQVQGSWTGFPSSAGVLCGKVMPSEGPTAFFGLKCGKDRENDTLTGHLSGAWSMKFEVARRKLEAAISSLNACAWSPVLSRPGKTAASAPPPPLEPVGKPALVGPNPVPTATTAPAEAAHNPDEEVRIEALMRALIQKANAEGLMTTGEANEVMKKTYSERSAHGLFTSLFNKLKARGWLRRVHDDGKVMLQIGTAFLRDKGMPVSFKERPEIPSSRGGNAPSSSSGEAVGEKTGGSPPTGLASAEGGDGEPPPAADVPAPTPDRANQTLTAISRLTHVRELMQRRDGLQAEISRLRALEAELAQLQAEIDATTASISREELLEMVLAKV